NTTPTAASSSQGLPHLPLLLAFTAIYVIWGSTYLAIKLVMDTLPPFIMVGLRFVLAGVVLLASAGLRGGSRPTARQLGTATGVGVMLLACGTGAVVWATQYLDSGLVALIVCFEPLWLAILMMAWPGIDARPDRGTFAALGLGLAGAVILVAPADTLGSVLGSESLHLPSILVVTFGCLSWAGGSLISRRADLPLYGPTSAGVQMLAGGLVLMAFGLGRGEWAAFDPANVSWTSVLAFLYLVIFGSLVAFSAFTWLMRNVNPTLVATHTYVNPAVAIFLGWWLADETIGPRTLTAAALILASVVMLTTLESRRSRRRKRDGATGPSESRDAQEPPPTTDGRLRPAEECA
ncbi:MAG: EamA family transporter, partial [Holophagales bacterium]|nr:EamA family transporter [Holophagales bacterium]